MPPARWPRVPTARGPAPQRCPAAASAASAHVALGPEKLSGASAAAHLFSQQTHFVQKNPAGQAGHRRASLFSGRGRRLGPAECSFQIRRPSSRNLQPQAGAAHKACVPRGSGLCTPHQQPSRGAQTRLCLPLATMSLVHTVSLSIYGLQHPHNTNREETVSEGK